MKRFYTLLYIIAVGIMTIAAQPAGVKKAAKSILKVTTFKADGSLLATGYGAFTDNEGTAVVAWTPFVGASSAVVIDGQGKKYDVESIYGASSIYNVAKLKVKISGKSSIIPVEIEPGQQSVGSEVWTIGYDVKKPQFYKHAVSKIETFMGDLPYYIIEQADGAINDEHIGTPFFNSQGQLMGLTNTSSKRTDLYVACTRYAMTLAPTAFSMNDNALRSTNIRIALPKEYNQAVIAMMIAAQRNDSINYPATIEEFISMFPDKQDGYTSKASYLTDRRDFAGADAIMAKAVEVSDQKDHAHYFYSKLIYNKEILLSDAPYEPWSLDKAIEEIDAAIALSPQALYSIHKGKVFFAKKQYNDALDTFTKVINDNYRDADVYYFAYQCMKNMESDYEKQVVLLDSAIAISPTEMLYQAEKALVLMKNNKAQEAIELCSQMIQKEPRYAEGHGLLGLALCLNGNTEAGITELKRAKAMGYPQADAFIRKYSKKE